MEEELDENMHITIEGDDGEKLDCEVVMYYSCDQNNIDYVFYTDNEKDEDGDYNLYASRFLGFEDGEIVIGDIETDEEWDLLEDALDQAKDGVNNG